MRPTIQSARWSRRGAAAVAAVLTLVLGLFVFAGSAHAHHSEIDAQVDCDYQVTWLAEAWNGSTDAQRTNPDVDVWYRLGAGPSVPVANGSFTSANGFEFGGTFPWPDLAEPSLTLYVQEQANWGNGASPSSARSITVRLPGDCPTPTIDVTADCDSVDITSTTDISNVVWQRQDGAEGQEAGLSGMAYSLPNDPANPIVAVWVKSGNNGLEAGDPAPSGDWGDVGAHQAVALPEGCGGVPRVEIDLSCVDGDGTAVVTLTNTSGYLPVTFVVTHPVTAAETVEVVPVGETRTVVLGDLPDGTHTVGVTADGVSRDQEITVDCDRPGVPEVEVDADCADFDGVVEVILGNVGGDLPVTFVVTHPVTAAETVEVVPVGETRTVTYTGLPDGEHTIAITADGTSLDQSVSFDCDRPGSPEVSATVECTEDGGLVAVVLANASPAATAEPITFVVTDPRDGSTTEVVVEAGASVTVELAGVADGTLPVPVTADGEDVGPIEVVVDCEQPEVGGVVQECAEEGMTIGITNTGGSPTEVTVFVDDELLDVVPVPAGDTVEVAIPMEEDETVAVEVRHGDEVLAELELTRNCEEPPTTTTTEPPSTTTAAPTTVAPDAPTTTATVLGTTQSRSGDLPVTGSDSGRLALAGGGLVAIGAGLLLLGQRRRL